MSLAANIPPLINYNGTLTDTTGNPVVDGTYDVTFNIYDASVDGTVLWTETWNSTTTQVMVENGNFNAMLGAHNPIPLSLFANNVNTYLGVTVGTDSEMMPRQRITSVGYAYAAENGIPSGGIIMWSGAIVDIPEGWALCDGANGTPDLRNRFVIGAGNTYTEGSSGGSATKNLSHTHSGPSHAHSRPNHAHTIAHGHYVSRVNDGTSWSNSAGGMSTGGDYGGSTMSGSQSTTASGNAGGGNSETAGGGNTSSGGSSSQNIMPPYYALAYIMKL